MIDIICNTCQSRERHTTRSAALLALDVHNILTRHDDLFISEPGNGAWVRVWAAEPMPALGMNSYDGRDE
jgi:hypothetical protein